MPKQLKALLPLAALVSFGCLFDSGAGKGSPTFVGEWKSTYEYEYTLGDSLYRDSLFEYMLKGGIHLDSFFSATADYPVDTARYNFLLRSFEWKCPDGSDCRADSLFYHYSEDMHVGQRYEFMGNGDSLRIFFGWDTLDRFGDTLVRLE